jgi:hypothetical protein
MKTQQPANKSEILFYKTDDGASRIEVRMEGETVWLTQGEMAKLFQTTPQNITIHLGTIFAEKERDENAICKEYLQVQLEGSREIRRMLKHYSLDAILAVGYRVRSNRGTQFRICASHITKNPPQQIWRTRPPSARGGFADSLNRAGARLYTVRITRSDSAFDLVFKVGEKELHDPQCYRTSLVFKEGVKSA